jgi:mannose-6-phosphate isomerase-like protein (cupin superfamily)
MNSASYSGQGGRSSELRPLPLSFVEGGEYRLLLEGSPTTCGMRCGRVVLKPGESAGEHTTGHHEEVLVILEGRGELWFRDFPSLSAEEGHLLYVPPETVHDVRNTGTVALRYLYLVAPVTGEAKEEPGQGLSTR